MTYCNANTNKWLQKCSPKPSSLGGDRLLPVHTNVAPSAQNEIDGMKSNRRNIIKIMEMLAQFYEGNRVTIVREHLDIEYKKRETDTVI